MRAHLLDSLATLGCSPFRTQGFSRLRATWYRRLKESGFTDIEGRDGLLTDRNHLEYVVKMDPSVREANATYFLMAADYLHTAEFPSQLERRIWELHADGVSVREIAALVVRGGSTVQRCITRHRVSLGLGMAGERENFNARRAQGDR